MLPPALLIACIPNMNQFFPCTLTEHLILSLYAKRDAYMLNSTFYKRELMLIPKENKQVV